MMAPSDPRSGSLFDLSPRIKLRVTGADRLRYLNGQLTNDVSKATRSSALAACVLNAKGRMEAHVFISAVKDAFWLDAEATLREKLRARLERYVIADDVQFEDASVQWSMFHVLSATAPNGLENCRTVSANRFHAQ